MSVLFKGMEMPKSCWQCQLLEGHSDDGLCKAANRWLDDEDYFDWYQYPEGDIDTSKPINCPLVEIPTPHGRLIDADAFQLGAYQMMFRKHADDRDVAFVNFNLQKAQTIIESETGDHEPHESK